MYSPIGSHVSEALNRYVQKKYFGNPKILFLFFLGTLNHYIKILATYVVKL